MPLERVRQPELVYRLTLEELFQGDAFVLPEIVRRKSEQIGSIRFRIIKNDGKEYIDTAFSGGSLRLGFRDVLPFDRESKAKYIAYVLDERGKLCFQLTCKQSGRYDEAGLYEWFRDEGIAYIEYIPGSEFEKPYAAEYVPNQVYTASKNAIVREKWSVEKILSGRAWVQNPVLRTRVIKALLERDSFDQVAQIIRSSGTLESETMEVTGKALNGIASRILNRKKGTAEEKKVALANALKEFGEKFHTDVANE